MLRVDKVAVVNVTKLTLRLSSSRKLRISCIYITMLLNTLLLPELPSFGNYTQHGNMVMLRASLRATTR